MSEEIVRPKISDEVLSACRDAEVALNGIIEITESDPTSEFSHQQPDSLEVNNTRLLQS